VTPLLSLLPFRLSGRKITDLTPRVPNLYIKKLNRFEYPKAIELLLYRGHRKTQFPKPKSLRSKASAAGPSLRRPLALRPRLATGLPFRIWCVRRLFDSSKKSF